MELNISCNICYELFTSSEGAAVDKKPTIICQNGHSACAECAELVRQNKNICPSCRAPLLAQMIVNRDLLQVIDIVNKAASQVPQIPINELKLASAPFASGAFADIFSAKWHSQDVVVKVLRVMTNNNENYDKQLRLESNVAMGLHHPNIVRIYGTTQLDRHFGVVMEKADRGSLDTVAKSLDLPSKVRISLGVVDGLAYLHSRKLAHRDLKPQNILLIGANLTPKIADFGTCKVLQTIITNSAMIGTPKYSAPELMQPGMRYGYSVDIFSLSIVLFELFSGTLADSFLGTNVMQIMLSLVTGKRPTFANDFPPALRPVVERGWSAKPEDRPSLGEIQAALQSMAPEEEQTPLHSTQSMAESAKQSMITVKEQTKDVAQKTQLDTVLPLSWSPDCELANSKALRLSMVKDIESKSNMSSTINSSVLRTMEMVPRHLFVEKSRLGAGQDNVLQAAYAYNRALPATIDSNESSPEIVGTQLSLTEISPGQSVLLVGIKGGYIQCIVAQLVGIHGQVVTVTSNQSALQVCKGRADAHSPLKGIMKWFLLENVRNPKCIVAEMRRHGLLFHNVIYCGASDTLPSELLQILHPNGIIIAPVRLKGDTLQFQLLIKREKNSKFEMEIKKITDFGVLFEDIK